MTLAEFSPCRLFLPNSNLSSIMAESGFMVVILEVASTLLSLCAMGGLEAGGHQDDWAANRTDGLMEVILDEVQLRSQSQPILLVGDFNCTPDRLPHLQALISDFSFVDFGAKVSFWGGQDNQDTCFPITPPWAAEATMCSATLRWCLLFTPSKCRRMRLSRCILFLGLACMH